MESRVLHAAGVEIAPERAARRVQLLYAGPLLVTLSLWTCSVMRRGAARRQTQLVNGAGPLPIDVPYTYG